MLITLPCAHRAYWLDEDSKAATARCVWLGTEAPASLPTCLTLVTGRKGLMDVLNMRNPGRPSDDSWMGHQLVDPRWAVQSAGQPVYATVPVLPCGPGASAVSTLAGSPARQLAAPARMGHDCDKQPACTISLAPVPSFSMCCCCQGMPCNPTHSCTVLCSKGKAHCPGPEQRMGRQDLFEIFQQRALQEPNKGASAGRVRRGVHCR